ncbi:MAG TPA: phosphoenolpyruvate-utilizing N-terminal domain-containing protein, partial [Stellaceae bacterium]|nr:phosphoenolpyruvate-utilizing N-terminal domain-containing protein [Stellaceae bacterium]
MRDADASSATTERDEQRLKGIGVSPGIAIGAAYIGDRDPVSVPEVAIPEGGVSVERARFAEAVANAQKQLRKLKVRAGSLPGSAPEELGYLLDAHLAMLANSRLVRGVNHRIANAHINAERAVELEIEQLAKGFAQMRDSYLAARVEDIRVVGNRLIRNLVKKPYVTYATLDGGAVILAEEVTPADTALMDPRRIGGFAAVFGGPESHSAIMARALGLPAVMGVAGL